MAHLLFGNLSFDILSRGGETICQEKMELDLQDRDQERAEVSEKAAVVGVRAEHDLGLDQAVTVSAHPAEPWLRISVANHVLRLHVPNVAPIW